MSLFEPQGGPPTTAFAALFPDELRLLAYAVGNGELFWPSNIGSKVAKVIADSGLGIYGGEVYVGRGRTWGNIELEWITDPGWLPGELWADFVRRALDQALAAVEQAELLTQLPELEHEREPMCFFACYSEPEYPRELRGASNDG
jgi:hypothetical protein